MPVDVVRYRVMDIENTMRELRRLVEKGFEDLSTDEVYSIIMWFWWRPLFP